MSNMNNTLSRLDVPARCDVFVAWMRQCGQPAYWLVNGYATCDEDIEAMADMNEDNEEFLRPALQDMATRRKEGHEEHDSTCNFGFV